MNPEDEKLDEGVYLCANEILMDRVEKAKDLLFECLHLNEIDPSIGLNALLSIFVTICIRGKVKKSVMQKTFSEFWDDFENQMNERKLKDV